MLTKYRLFIIFVGLGGLLVAIGLVTGNTGNFAEWMTYRDFDVPGKQNFIRYLLPGVPDVSTGTSYDFERPKWGLFLVVALVFFPLMLAARALGSPDVKLKVRRWLTQWLTFVLARAGILRVAGICPVGRSGLGVFPFLNCQSCELATGACPIGTIQMSLLNQKFPLFVLGYLTLLGALLGRWLCGWLCPFGFLSDIFDRFSLHRFTPPKWLGYGKYAAIGILALSGLLAKLHPNTDFLLFCAFFCPGGFFYGVLEYDLTTGFRTLRDGLPLVHIMLVYHFLFAALYLVAIRFTTGRLYCRYFCPLGGFYGLFNRFALIRIIHGEGSCNNCGACGRVCPMGADLGEDTFLDRSNCIACGLCVKVCSKGSRRYSFDLSSVLAGMKEENIIGSWWQKIWRREAPALESENAPPKQGADRDGVYYLIFGNQPPIALRKDRPFTIGRSKGNDLILTPIYVSRTHALLKWDGSRFVAKDRGSKWVTSVNGRRVEESPLEPGDVIEIGDISIRFDSNPN